MPRPRYRTGADDDPLLSVEADYRAVPKVVLAVDPDLALVVDVRLEKDRGPGDPYAVDRLGKLHRDAVPGERETLRQELADVVTGLPSPCAGRPLGSGPA